MDFKVGDVVHVRARVVGLDTLPGCSFPVVEISCGDVDVADLEHHGLTNIYVPRVYVVHVEPRPIAVGDTVRHIGTDHGTFQQCMHVNAIVDGRAWCRSSGYDYIIEVERLERVEKVKR